MSIFHRKDKDKNSDQSEPKHEKKFRGGYVPVHGSEKTADKLAMKAYGDSDGDGKPDVPNVPFPG
jgi:hypothetical protein